MRAFDLDRYVRASRRLDLDGIDFGRVADHPLSDEEARVLTYMMDIETHTVVYLRDLLTTPAARDAEVTAFLSMWVYEEFWHGEALGRFLRASGRSVESARPTQIRRSLGLRDALGTIGTMLAAYAVPDFVAVHMAWGAVNELSTLNGYQRLIARTRHPILVELLSRIIKDERRHYAFYYNQARGRLEGNRRAQRLARWALGRLWQPVGTGVVPQAETDFVVAHLFGDRDGRAAIEAMEHELSTLPGLHGMRILSRASASAARRSRSAPAASRWPVAASLT